MIAEQNSATQLQIRRQPPAPLEIPLQPQRIESHSIRRIRRLKNQISRHRIHRIFKPPPQDSRQMRSRKHPPIAQPQIKDSRSRSPARHRMSAPSPNLHFVPALYRPSLRLPKPRSRGQNHKNEDTEKGNQKSPAQTLLSRHGPMRLPDARAFCKAEGCLRQVCQDSSFLAALVLRKIFAENLPKLEVSTKGNAVARNSRLSAGTEFFKVLPCRRLSR
jgi:hypothetical protein